jgi:hypothetical protein
VTWFELGLMLASRVTLTLIVAGFATFAFLDDGDLSLMAAVMAVIFLILYVAVRIYWRVFMRQRRVTIAGSGSNGISSVTVTRFELGAMIGVGVALLLFIAGFAIVGLGAEGDLAIMAFSIAAMLFVLLALLSLRWTLNIRKRRRTPPSR